MDIILLVVTIVSVVTAVIALAAASRVHRNERRRSDARVAALAAAADAHGAGEGWKQVAGEWQWVAEPVGVRERPQNIDAPIGAPITAAPAISFGTVQRGEATTARLPLFAAAVLIMILGGAVLFLRTSAQDSGLTPAHTTAQAVDPLELVSLGHSRDARSLTITGTVRNPTSGHTLEGLTAVVSLLDNNGGLVSTKDVPLDYRALGPGEEAPFKVSVPDPGAISRYRVSFRAGTEVVPHLDRRSETKLASALR